MRRRMSWHGWAPAPRPPWPGLSRPAARPSRVIKDTCPGGLAELLGYDPAGADTLALDGKSARGSRHGSTPAAHLLAAMTGTGLTVNPAAGPENSKTMIKA
ncbi:hypothetical protein ACIQNI_28350 [Streptomyces sp. NPDC091266]|uniref:hypothetical protein n=1 Tax=Streptomyces sp. NPDC091266 TaxID=3365978 RepID=UPI0037F3BC09